MIDRGEVLSSAMIDLVKEMDRLSETFEGWDHQQFVSSGRHEWRDFRRALDRVNSVVRRLDSSLYSS